MCMQKMSKSLRKLAQKLSCMDTPWEVPDYPLHSRGSASASLRTPTASSDPVTGSTFGARTPPHHPEMQLVDDEDEEEDDKDAPGFGIHHHQRYPYQQGPSQQGPYQQGPS
jgi:hypothetical protein